MNSHVPSTHSVLLDEVTLTGRPIASKLGNETAKAELGRSAWKVFHTTFARFPDKPTGDERTALKSYIYLFQRLYPCGECASHFGEILDRYPPQVSSRSAAAAWGCHVHNEVNKSLKKELFDCSKIGDFYDCGCAEGEDDKKHADKETEDDVVDNEHGHVKLDHIAVGDDLPRGLKQEGCDANLLSRKVQSQSDSGDPARQLSNYQKPYIEEHTLDNQVAKIDVPPPAPSPPRPNVFDFLVSEKSSPSASESQRRHHSSSSIGSEPFPTTREHPKANETIRGNAVEGAYTYGHEPVQSLGQNHRADIGYVMDVDSNPVAPLGTGDMIPAEQKTPAVKYHPDTLSSGNRSEKKRKRPSNNDWDEEREYRGSTITSESLHSGLTGGVQKMMKRSKAREVEDSPSSPKKRSRRIKEPASIRPGREREPSPAHTTKSKGSRDANEHHQRGGLHRSQQYAESKNKQPGRDLAHPEPHSNTAGPFEEARSNSGLFLSLVDKGHYSHKGQSIWGTLKIFHDACSKQGTRRDYEADGARQREEKALMKGLRMKLNRQGEVVLFSRPDRERDGSPVEEEEPRKKIEGRKLKQIEGPR
ncbi:MAG: hypothetical protein M1831_000776 [Alyxoria varia]|nr:MAG: hypothetical protein M1831_000776 [Alyxoria varia]